MDGGYTCFVSRLFFSFYRQLAFLVPGSLSLSTFLSCAPFSSLSRYLLIWTKYWERKGEQDEQGSLGRNYNTVHSGKRLFRSPHSSMIHLLRSFGMLDVLLALGIQREYLSTNSVDVALDILCPKFSSRKSFVFLPKLHVDWWEVL